MCPALVAFDFDTLDAQLVENHHELMKAQRLVRLQLIRGEVTENGNATGNGPRPLASAAPRKSRYSQESTRARNRQRRAFRAAITGVRSMASCTACLLDVGSGSSRSAIATRITVARSRRGSRQGGLLRFSTFHSAGYPGYIAIESRLPARAPVRGLVILCL